MTEKTSMVLGDIQAPKGLDPLRREIIHPDNVALEARVRRAELLSLRNVASLRIRRKRHQADYEQYVTAKRELNAIRRQMAIYEDEYKTARAILEAHTYTLPGPMIPAAGAIVAAAVTGLDRLKADVHRAKSRAFTLKQLLARIEPNAREYHRLNQTITAYEIAVQRKREETTEAAALREEAAIWKKYIRLTWAKLPTCHHAYERNGKKEKDVPDFSRVDITPTATFFKIASSKKAAFGWINTLPYGVYLDDLISERTLANVALAVQRKVHTVTNPNGAWIVVERLNAVDGIRDLLLYQQILEYYPDWLNGDMPVCAGVGMNSTLKWLNFSDFPHWLIAGETGGGKSNAINALICMLIQHQSPADLRFAMIDLKGGLEFTHYEGMPHLIGNIIDNVDDVGDMLARLVGEMNRRFGLLRSRRAKRIEAYNKYVSDEDRLPRIAIVFDEFGTMRDQGDLTKSIFASVRQIGNRGRAVGIHLIICTQHSSVDVIPGSIKTNLVVRLSGRMSTSSASVTILGTGDAAHLPDIPGRMMLKLGATPETVQTPRVDDNDIKAAMAAARAFDPPLNEVELEQVEAVVQERWTVERVIEHSIKHMGGKISARPTFEDLKEDGVTFREATELVERIWQMDEIIYNDQQYTIIKRGRTRFLVPVEPEEKSNEND